MNNLIVGAMIFLLSLMLGLIKYGSIASAYKHAPWQLKFIEIWNCIISFVITGIIGYYFALIRWPLLLSGGELKTSDFTLFVIFALGLFGHLNVISNNLTRGIEAIIAKILDRK